jgi:hypothetical protein
MTHDGAVAGFWGAIICVLFLYPVTYYTGAEDPWNTYTMIVNSTTLQWAIAMFVFNVLMVNVLSVLVTFILSSVWHAILDNFRPITLWIADLYLFYAVSHHRVGESWTQYSWIQLAGLVVLLYGTAVYNGSIRLSGRAIDLFLDFSSEYSAYDKADQVERDIEGDDTLPKADTSNIASSPHLTTIKPFLTSPRKKRGEGSPRRQPTRMNELTPINRK